MQTKNNLTLTEFREILTKCSGKTIAMDTETTGLYWWHDHLTTVGFHCPTVGVEGTIDIGRPVEDAETDKELHMFETAVRLAIKECLAPGTKVVMHNAKFDMNFMGVDPKDCYGWKIIDSAVMIHLWDSREKKSLESAEKKFLGTNSKRAHIEEAPTNPKIRKKVWLWEADVRQDYCVNDTRVTLQLAQAFMPLLKQEDLWTLFQKDMRYLKLVYKTEHYGWLTDVEYINRSYLALMDHARDLEQRLYDGVGYEFNWRSHKQLSKALYDDMGISRPDNPFASQGQNKGYKTKLGFERVQELKGGMYNSTMTSTFLLMEKVKHPLGELIAALREASKLARQLNQWSTLMDDNNVIHANFNITGTRTGRLSVSKPNLANVPSDVRGRFTQGTFSGGTTRTDEYNLRKGFISRPGHKLVSVDYKQMEMRMFGIDSQDANMLEALMSGVDIHLYIAHKVWGKCGDKEDKIHREWSKTIGFGLIYGMTTGALEHKLGMTRQQSQQVVDDYWGAFPGIRPWLFDTVNTCKTYGYIRYWSGRLWREETEMFMYKGANAKIQGGCADLLSIAALRLDDWLVANNMGTIISYIYDELIVECKEENQYTVADKMLEIMQVPDLFGIPFLTDAKIGDSYGTLEEYKHESLKA